MLISLHSEIQQNQFPHAHKTVCGRACDMFGAFPRGKKIEFSLTVPRRLGVMGAVLRMNGDGKEAADFLMPFFGSDGVCDEYRFTLDTAKVCGEDGGLFYYEYIFMRGFDTLFSDTENNLDLKLSPKSARKFALLITQSDFHTPEWFPGGVMYHIFLDRFCRGKGEVALREGGVLEKDWENGIPQYANRVGEPLANNRFFGGNLWGVIEKLDVLATLGVTVLYLSPVFEAASNHRYDTGDYEKIDSLLGGEQAFDMLIGEAHKRGMRVILDGVFNHTGDDSKYFNKYGKYREIGAYQSESSPYADWFSFEQFPNKYESWWGIEILPRLRQSNPDCRRFFTGKEGIAEKWIRRGIDGWRLDVADELCDGFLEEFRRSVKEASQGEGLILGEVWENAVEKIAYGKRRRYFGGGQLDGVMNYPFRNAVLSFVNDRDGNAFYNTLCEIYGSYPKEVSDCLMNLLGTHDTERILSLLGDRDSATLSNGELARIRLSPEQRKLAKEKLKLASVLQFTVYGVPSVYYGDEAGMEGYRDPFCRFPYPWGREDLELFEHYQRLGALRARERELFAKGDFSFLDHGEDFAVYQRKYKEKRVIVLANVGKPREFLLPNGKWKDAFDGTKVFKAVTLEIYGFCVLLA